MGTLGLLDERLVACGLHAATLPAVIKQLIDRASKVHPITDTLGLLQSLVNGDNLQSFLLDWGKPSAPAALLMHTRSECLAGTITCIGICPEGVPYRPPFHERVHIFAAMVVAPHEAAASVWALIALRAALERPEVREAMIRAMSPAEAAWLLDEAYAREQTRKTNTGGKT